MIHSIHLWLTASRPKTLVASIAPVAMGTCLAFQHNTPNPFIAILTLLASIAIQIGTNFANDYFDFKKGADTPNRIGPTRAVAAGLIPATHMKSAFILAFSIAFLIGLYLMWIGGWPIIVIGILSLLFGVLYTAGPYPLAYVGLGDLFVFIFFGPVAVAGTYYLQTHALSLPVIIAGLAPGLISTAVLAVNNLRDQEEDSQTNKKTLAVRFGKTFARWEYTLCVVIGCLVPFSLVTSDTLPTLLPSATLLFFIPLIRTIMTQNGPILNTVLAKTGAGLALYTLLFCIAYQL